MGITEIFENTATFPLLARGGTSEGKLKVSNIVQKSGIVVDEKGTVAWSATGKLNFHPKGFVKLSIFPFLRNRTCE
jgi:serine protease inhibitor